MRGRKPAGYKLSATDRRYLTEIATDGQLIQRIARRARILLALDRGERIVEVLRWTDMSRMGVWHLWQRYLERGVEAIFEGKRSGRPPVFPPLSSGVQIERVACTEPASYGLHLSRWDCRTLQQVLIEQAIVETIHYTTVARILAEAGLQPHRSRYWKTATIDEEFTTRAAQILWCYERVEWLRRRGEVVIGVDEKPNIQALERLKPTQPMHPGQIARREFEYKRHGTINLLVAFNVFEGLMWACCLEANDHEHFLWALHQISRRWARARRIHLIMDNGASHIDHHTREYLAEHTRFRPLYTPAHASWLNQAELLLRAFTDKYLKHFEAASRQHLIEHLNAGWPEYNQWFAHPFEWSWTRRKMHDWAAKKQISIRTKTYATVH